MLNATDDPRLGAMVNNFREVTGRLESERELRRAKSAAEEAQRLQQHFLTNLSHEFKTPLTLIRGPLEVLAADPALTERSRQTLGLMFRNVERLDALLTELVDLARLEAGAFALKVKRHELGAFLRRQVAAFEGLAREKSIALQLELPGECEVFFDEAKLEKVIANLLGNALKFSPSQTTIRVSLYVRADAEGEGHVEVAVSDQGPGMDEATRARVFERFFQGDAGLARGRAGGAALGEDSVAPAVGEGAVDQRLEGLKAGADDYMAKPFSVPELLHRLRTRLPVPAAGAAGEETVDPEWLERLEVCIAENMAKADFNVSALARGVGYSPRQFRRRVIEHQGVTPASLLLERRLRRAREAIEQKRFETVAQVANAVGLSPSYFSRRYRQAYACEEIRL